MSSLLTLPDELLVQICSEVPGQHHERVQTWIDISLSCRRLCPISREVLLANPVCTLEAVTLLTRTYLQYPELASRVRCLNLVRGTAQKATTHAHPTCHKPRKSSKQSGTSDAGHCARMNFIGEIDIPNPCKMDWMVAITLNNTIANLCVLLMVLKGLKKLDIGPYEDVYWNLLETPRDEAEAGKDAGIDFRGVARKTLVETLQVLDISNTQPGSGLRTSILKLSHFKNLQQLIVLKEMAIAPFFSGFPITGRLDPAGAIRQDSYPKSLEVLKLVNVPPISQSFIGYIYDTLLQKETLPKLRRIELHMRLKNSCSLLEEVKRRCRQHGVELCKKEPLER
ncbi:hypothetical protein BS50DRAFT_591396 [Corynespora cassiicola Philippines]|uniref:F-box domain-containing protein n=1 Tax=Corynespora cassiicola Philippines TaxID=1448308 RepID=A0A2T2NCP3_CORCC|nr:hypothetical protein BS50DRAFT_591396 [Corynespora cassiicola Philippines]